MQVLRPGAGRRPPVARAAPRPTVLVALLALTWAIPANSQDAPQPPQEAGYELPAPSLSTSVDALWFGPEPSIGALRALRQERSIAALPRHGSALAARGFAALENGDREAARTAFEDALELDPESVDARLGLAAVEAKAGPVNPRFLSQLLAANRTRARRLTSLPFSRAGWLLTLAAALAIAGCVTILALTARHNGPIRHDIEEWVKRSLDPRLAKAVAWLVLVLPLLIRFDLHWAVLWWAVLLAVYLDLKERIVLVASVLLLASSTPLVAIATTLLESVGEPYTRAAAMQLESYLDAAGVQRLEKAIASGEGGTEARMLLGLIYESDGAPRRALDEFTELADTDRSPEVYNNLGNVHYRLTEKDKAFENWSRALELDPSFAPAHYNLSRYYIDHFQFDKKEEHFNRAKDADPALINNFVREQGDRKGTGSGLIDSGIKPEQVRRRIWAGASAAAAAAVKSVNVLAALAALVIGLVLTLQRKDVAAACERCGQPYCPHCRPGKDSAKLCSQCVHLFHRRDGVSPQMRADKMAQIGSHNRLARVRAMVLSLMLPGSGQIAQRQTLLGFGFALFWSASLALWLTHAGAPLEPGLLARSLQVQPAWTGLIGVAAAWLMANITTLVSRG